LCRGGKGWGRGCRKKRVARREWDSCKGVWRAFFSMWTGAFGKSPINTQWKGGKWSVLCTRER